MYKTPSRLDRFVDWLPEAVAWWVVVVGIGVCSVTIGMAITLVVEAMCSLGR